MTRKKSRPTVQELAEALGIAEITIRKRIQKIRKEGGPIPEMEYRPDGRGYDRLTQVCGAALAKEIEDRIKYRRAKGEE